ncbi:MAG TPA: TIGR01777 family oxidoreductase [Candidatus Limnocylindrales bacterium]
MRIVVAGGSGMIGRRLVDSLVGDDHSVDVLTRSARQTERRLPRGARAVEWRVEPSRELARLLEGADAVVNLAGVSIGPRPWTRARKRAIRASRLAATAALTDALAMTAPERRPAVLVNASGTDVYTGRDTEPATEATEPADDFLARVCVDWEAAAREAEGLGVRVAIVRQAFVLAPDAPVLALMALPFRLFLGGRLGSGRQWFSWIHIDDLVAIYRRAIDDPALSGPINAASPEPCRNTEFAAALGRALGRPNWLPVPAWLLRLVLRDQSTLVIGSRRAVPARAMQLAFPFRFTELERALRDALGRGGGRE